MVTGDPIQYVSSGGTITPRLAGDILYRKAHPEPVRKPAGLDWDAHTPTCHGCHQRSGQIDGTGLCPGCRGEKAVNLIQANVTTDRASTYATLDAQDITDRFTPPAPRGEAAPTDVGAPVVPSTSKTNGTAMPSTPRPAVRAKVRRTSSHEVVITLCSTTDPIDPVVVAALLSDLLTALSARTPQSPAAAPRPSPVSGAAAGPQSEGRRPVGKQARPAGAPRGPRPDKINLPSPDVEDAYTAGATIRDLADRYQVSPPTISRHLDEHDVVRRKQKVDYTPELIESVRARYVDQQMSQADVAADLRTTLKVVQTAMAKGKIQPRESAAERSKRGIGHPTKLQPDDQQNIVDAYLAGERASVIATRHGITTASLYHCLDKHRIPRHGRRAPGLGQDGARGLKDQLAAMTAPSREIKEWAVAQGLVDHIARGVPAQRLVDAYAAAHPTTHQEAS